MPDAGFDDIGMRRSPKSNLKWNLHGVTSAQRGRLASLPNPRRMDLRFAHEARGLSLCNMLVVPNALRAGCDWRRGEPFEAGA
jgi:hypothetical protein